MCDLCVTVMENPRVISELDLLNDLGLDRVALYELTLLSLNSNKLSSKEKIKRLKKKQKRLNKKVTNLRIKNLYLSD